MNGRDKSILAAAFFTGFVVFIVIFLFGGVGLFIAPFLIVGSILGWVNEDRRIRQQDEEQRLNNFNRNRRP